MKWLEKILDNKWAVTIAFILIAILVIYFLFVHPKRRAKNQRQFTIADIPAEGAREGNQQEIFEKSKTLADALFNDMSGPNINHRVELYEELALSSDVFFKAVWNQFGIREGEDLYEWLVNEFALVTIVPVFSGFTKYRNQILERIDALKLR